MEKGAFANSSTSRTFTWKGYSCGSLLFHGFPAAVITFLTDGLGLRSSSVSSARLCTQAAQHWEILHRHCNSELRSRVREEEGLHYKLITATTKCKSGLTCHRRTTRSNNAAELPLTHVKEREQGDERCSVLVAGHSLNLPDAGTHFLLQFHRIRDSWKACL